MFHNLIVITQTAGETLMREFGHAFKRLDVIVMQFGRALHDGFGDELEAFKRVKFTPLFPESSRVEVFPIECTAPVSDSLTPTTRFHMGREPGRGPTLSRASKRRIEARRLEAATVAV